MSASHTSAHKTADSLGQPMVIDNRGGAGGTTGASLFAKAQPDGLPRMGKM